MDRTRFGMAVVLGFALAASHVAAQKTYRCGNTFQDRPCAAVQSAPQPTTTTPPAAAAPSSEARPAAKQPEQQSASARQAQRRRDLCESLNLQLEDVHARERARGNATAVENLGKQRRAIEDKLSANRC